MNINYELNPNIKLLTSKYKEAKIITIPIKILAIPELLFFILNPPMIGIMPAMRNKSLNNNRGHLIVPFNFLII